jgi:hypothetical protein
MYKPPLSVDCRSNQKELAVKKKENSRILMILSAKIVPRRLKFEK